jgi:hypothetical protein
MANIASDTFDGYTPGTTLHDSNASWVRHASNATSAWISDANRIRRNANNGLCFYYYNATPSSADYSVSAQIFVKSTGTGDLTAVAGRIATGANTCYYARSNANNWQLYKVVAGTPTQLGSNSAQTLSDETGYTIKLEMNGSSISLWVDGSRVIGPITDTAISAAGYAGFRMSGSGTGDSDTVGHHIDNWTADTLGATAHDIAQSGAIGITGAVAVLGDITSQGQFWRVPTNASNGQIVYVTVFSGTSPNFSIVAQGSAVVAGGYARIPATTGTAGDKAKAHLDSFAGDTSTTDMYGGPAIATRYTGL